MGDRLAGGGAAPPPQATQSGARPSSAPPPSRWWVLAVLCVPLLVISLDNTVLNVALPTLVRKLHATTEQLQWIVDAYALVFGGLMLVAGSLADRVGRRRTFIAGLLVFAAGSGWAAASGSVQMLIAARAGMGVGAALIMPSTLAIITNTFADAAERQRALGFWSGDQRRRHRARADRRGPAARPFLVGLGVPGERADRAAGSARRAADRPRLARPGCRAHGLHRFAALDRRRRHVVVGDHRGTRARLVVGVVIGAGAGALVLLAAFVVWERRSTHPMLNLHYFAERRFSAGVLSNGLLAFGLFGSLFVLTQMLQFQLGYTPLQAGVRVLPAAGAIALAAPLSSLLVRAVGTKLAVGGGLLTAAAGLWLVSGASVTSTYSDIVPGMVLIGVGAGLALPSATGAVMGSLPSAHTGVGAATNGSFMQVGGALGVAVVGSLLSTRYEHRIDAAIAPYHVPSAIAETIRGSLGGALEVAHRIGGLTGEALAHAAHAAFISGTNLGLGVASIVVLAGALLALAALPGRR